MSLVSLQGWTTGECTQTRRVYRWWAKWPTQQHIQSDPHTVPQQLRKRRTIQDQLPRYFCLLTFIHREADSFLNSFTLQLFFPFSHSSLQTPVLLTPSHHSQCRNPDGQQRVQNRFVPHLFLIQTIKSTVPGLSMCGVWVCGLCQCTQNILNIEAGCQFIFRLERLSLIMFPE